MAEPSELTADEAGTAAVAARRRSRKAPPPPPAAAPAPPEVAAAADAADGDAEAPVPVIVSRAALADYLQRADGAQANFGSWGTMSTALPAVLAPHQGIPVRGRYVRAEFDATEQMIPPRARTPVNRLLFRAGWHVREDVYAEILRQHREGTSFEAIAPAEVEPPMKNPEHVPDPAVVPVGAPAQG